MEESQSRGCEYSSLQEHDIEIHTGHFSHGLFLSHSTIAKFGIQYRRSINKAQSSLSYLCL